MKKNLLLCVLILAGEIVLSQNLVPNNGFDTYTVCPNTSSQYDITPPWFSPAGQTASPDYMNECFTGGQQGAPLNFYGYQMPVSSGGYYGLITYYNGLEVREYMSTQLTSPLVAGTSYTVTMHVSMSDNFNFATDHFGAYLSVGAITGPGTIGALTAFIPQVDNGAGNVISDTTNWTTISGVYVAAGGENYITIGNFYSDANTQAVNVFPSHTLPWGYYYVDEISVSSQCATPTVNFVASATDICKGTCIEFVSTVNPLPQSYSWTFEGGNPHTSTDADPQNICFDTTGNYSISLEVVNGACSNSSTHVNYIRVHQPAQPVVTMSGDTLYSNAPSAASYQWYDVNGAIGSAFFENYVPTHSGYFHVCVKDAFDCENCSDSVYYSPTGIAVYANGSAEIFVYPNPASDKLTVISYSLNEKSAIKILNVVGEILYQSKITNQKSEIDLTDFTRGIYFLKFKNENGTVVKKFVKD